MFVAIGLLSEHCCCLWYPATLSGLSTTCGDIVLYLSSGALAEQQRQAKGSACLCAVRLLGLMAAPLLVGLDLAE